MTWNRQTQLIILVGGLLVWGAVLYWRVTAPGPAPPVRPQSEAPTKGSRGAPPSKKGAARSGGEIPALRLDLLGRPRPPLTGEAKNLFAPVLPPPPPPPPAKASAPAAPPPDPFLEEAKKLKIVAVMQEDGQRTAFIEDGNEVHNVKKNDVIRSRFLIKDLTDDAVLVSMPNGEKEVRLSLASPAGPAGGPARP